MVYQLTSPAIREALRAKAAAGVEVHVILDAKQQPVNQTTFDVLTAAGAQVQWSDPAFTYTHAKFTIADEAVAVISTGNYDTFVRSGRNFGAIDRDALDVRALVGLFDADWTHVAPKLDCTRLVVSPNNSRARHLELLRSATQTLIVESMQFSDSQVRQAVLERKQAGVAVRVLLAAPSWVGANQSAGAWLKANGIEARWRSSPAVHVKAFVIDGATAFLGSENLSYTSLSSNREVGLVTREDDDVALISTTFEQDWATATAF
jgi:phosphatidylserine/phosphatidylglycerophosphate/cardiolipin synthase-like enzyme